MALDINIWNGLSIQDKDSVVNFLKGNCKIDREHSSNSQSTPNSYPISDGITVGGYKMKFGEEYRMYVKDITGIPSFLDAELKERETRKRIGGTDAIKAIMEYGGLVVGKN